ncbi:MAG TPA: MFS transporter [Friedmanniella sp.]
MTAPTDGAVRLRRASLGVFVCFALSGFNFASWASRLPAVQDGLGLRKDQMGLLLFTGAVASVAALPLSGLVVERLGTRATVLWAAALNAGGLAVAGLAAGAGSVTGTVAGLVVYGVGTATWDAAMNIEGAAVEQRLGRTVMPRYHAGFSLGTVVAAALSAGLAALHVPIGLHLPVVLAASYVALVWSVAGFLPRAEEPHRAVASASGAHRGARGALAAWGDGRTLLVGLVVLAAALTEGSANDWLSLSVVDGWKTPDAVGALGLWLFVAAMTTMRWFATALLDRFGRVTVLRLCAALSIVGLLVFGLVGPLPLALAGVLIWGAGAAVGFPVGMSAASDDPLHAAQRVAVVSTIGYAAFLAGPPVLGLLAQHLGYRHALLVICVPVLLGLLVTRSAAPLRPTSPQAAPTLES